jgi:excisionase family DNA binding protein
MATPTVSRPETRGRDDMLGSGSVTVEGAVREFGIGRSRLYEMMNGGLLKYYKLGGRRLIPRDALRALIAGA